MFNRIALMIGTMVLLYSLAMFFRLPIATQFWIWPKAPPLTFAFAGSWFAGGGTALVWYGLVRHWAALHALLLTVLVAYAGSATHLFAKHTLPGNERYLFNAALFGIGALTAAGVLAALARVPPPADRPVPVVIRWAFLLFAAILLPTGVSLIFDAQHVFPVPLRTDMAVVYGWFFLGSFVYYFYGFLKPSDLTTTGPMLSFLVYDLLLIPRFLGYWDAVGPELRTSLFVYLSVLIGSAIFCGFFLFIDRRTRLIRRPPPHSRH